MSVRVSDRCRSCGARALEPVLPLGELPLANALVSADALERPDPVYPLTFAVCRACALAQILETVPPETLFSDYPYFSSYSDTMLRHARESANELVDRRKLGAGSLVVELASNDGYQLLPFQKQGVPVLGVEPAANVAEVARERGVPTRVAFFDAAYADVLAGEGVRADVVLAYNVLAHVPDPNPFVAGIRRLLRSDGIAVIEVPDVGQLLAHAEFDTIYHEHMSYFSLAALAPLFARHDLELFDVAELPLHGGSFRLYVAPAGRESPTDRVRAVERRERETGIADGGAFASLGPRVEGLRRALLDRIEQRTASGARLAAYGAAAKATTLLNYFGLDARRIEFAADRSPHKQGRYIPGVRIPIVAPEALLERRPELCLLTTWNFADEILAQQQAYRDAGGRFLVPLPELREL